MYIQVLTFDLSKSDREEASRFCQHAILGLGEFDGFVSETCLTQPEADMFGGMIAWADWKSLEAFRHSELYAKLLMSHHVENVHDRAFGVSDRNAMALQSELLTVA